MLEIGLLALAVFVVLIIGIEAINNIRESAYQRGYQQGTIDTINRHIRKND